jgi:uncharacterized protein (DUF2062 family)
MGADVLTGMVIGAVLTAFLFAAVVIATDG